MCICIERDICIHMYIYTHIYIYIYIYIYMYAGPARDGVVHKAALVHGSPDIELINSVLSLNTDNLQIRLSMYML